MPLISGPTATKFPRPERLEWVAAEFVVLSGPSTTARNATHNLITAGTSPAALRRSAVGLVKFHCRPLRAPSRHEMTLSNVVGVRCVAHNRTHRHLPQADDSIVRLAARPESRLTESATRADRLR